MPAILASRRDPDSEWRPHIGLELIVQRRIRAYHAYHLVTPMPWPTEAFATSWPVAVQASQAKLHHAQLVPAPLPHEPSALLRRVFDDWAGDLTLRYATWSHAVELAVGIHTPGTGLLPRARWKPIVPKKPPFDWASSPRERAWQRLAGYMRELLTCTQQQAREFHPARQAHRQRIVSQLRPLLK